MEGIITHIQRLSIHDGPGIRSVIFLKGCNMRCAWCHNPETFYKRRQLQFYPEKCNACLECLKKCDEEALKVENGKISLNRELCSECMECLSVCYNVVLKSVGVKHTVESLLADLRKDFPFFKTSNGGVTLSGGEPMMQFGFVAELLQSLKSEGVHVCIETNLSLPWEKYEPVLELVDYWLVDLKMIDEEQHKKWTKISNKRILKNIKKLDQSGYSYELRCPVVPEVNDSDESIKAIGNFLKGLDNAQQFTLNPFHRLGEPKYQALGMESAFECNEEVSKSKIEHLNQILNDENIR
ncbi:glycyl-radical enzyme activating protein [Aureibacter tunicatorum]|uniref:Pyruvate formate lyase activating enzyme n=1 Tax=Aureibacter tunicatorum TaxID=866807 RepID=A0AAE3XP49_9BACT|nr:glycyl-radical enzyme activating protein [Aureibacter tunicatorum]MDR6239543.1 pyruvate formate lyase activating enzyme [Aureibacter tunicatorum]BDD04020.1 glycyl-radical enzyme activating protein [Aureibacter tunicatorum]